MIINYKRFFNERKKDGRKEGKERNRICTNREGISKKMEVGLREVSVGDNNKEEYGTNTRRYYRCILEKRTYDNKHCN
jgi:hypothetical protein